MRVVLCLALVAVVVAQITSKQVTGLPNSQNIDDVSYAGYATINPKVNGNLFYWWFESRGNPDTDPLVLWLTGGPGCSSELALLFENGPFSLGGDGETLEKNPYSWNNNANLLYVDQPYGTGFSYAKSGFPHNEAEIASDMYTFLQMFLKEYPQFATRPFYVTGESYAGHYIPAITAAIVAGNQAGSGAKINLVGAAIGNGWVDPYIQYGAYAPFGLANGLIDGLVEDAANATYLACKGLLDLHLWVPADDECSLIMEEVIAAAPKIDGYSINIYNIKQPCTVPGLCYDFTNQTNYMNLPATQKALGVDQAWQTCSEAAGLPLLSDRAMSYMQDLPSVLAAGVQVLVYNGMYDLICNYFGGRTWTDQMSWPGQSAFNAATINDWTVGGNLAGHVKTAQNLTFLAVEAAGHMVPHDQPVAALQMITTFLNGQPFAN